MSGSTSISCLISDSNNNRDLVVDGETGFVIPPEDIDSFIDKLLCLKNPPDISYRMGKAGYKKVISLPSIERLINVY